MFQQTPQKRVLFPRAMNRFMAGGFVVYLVFLLLMSVIVQSRT
ncbi:MAG: hypothetical protein JWR85_3442, partial [Marmoricola sp.]|nr:hypothetical protein [Marmoricola sp.]